MKYLRIYLILIALLTINKLLFPIALNEGEIAVDSTKTESIIFSIEIGGFFKTNTSETHSDICIGAELTYKVKSNFYSLSYLNGREYGVFLDDDEMNYSNLFALTYGRKIFSKSRWSLIPSLGVSYVDGRRRTEYENYSWGTRSYQAIGIYGELNIMIAIVKNVNIGLGVFSNINKEVNYSGIKMIVSFGQMD